MQSNNPFQTHGISGSIFCEGINTEPLKVILDTYHNLKSVVSIAITGETGTGKTTLFNKVRRNVENNSNGFFVSVQGHQITHVEDVEYYVLRALVKELTRESSSEVSFIQQLATNIVNESLKLSNQDIQFEAENLIKKFDYLARNREMVEKVRKIYQKHHPEFNVSSNLLRAILWTLSAEASIQASDDSYLCASAVAWLKGEPISENEAKTMKIPPQLAIINNNKEESLETLHDLLRIVSEYYSVVLAFDELESIKDNNFGQKYWVDLLRFIAKLHDKITNSNDQLLNLSLKNNTLLLTAWLPPTWKQFQNDSSLLNSIETYIARLCSLSSLNRKPLKIIDFLSKEEGLNLLACWLKELKGNSSQNPYEPFKQSKIEAFLNSGPTPRQLWNWCAKEWPDEVTPPLPLQEIFNTYQSQVDESIFKDDHHIAHLLELSFNLVKGETIENVIVHQIKKMPQSAKFQLLLTGIENHETIKVGIGVCQGPATRVGAMVKKLLDLDKKHSLTRGCFIRSKQLKLDPKIKAFQNIQQLVNDQDGEYVDLIDHQLFELEVLFQSLDFFKENDITLTPQDEEFKRKILTKNGLIKEILSAPEPNLDDLVKVWNPAPTKENDLDFSPNNGEIDDLTSDDFEIDQGEIDNQEEETDEVSDEEILKAIYLSVADLYHEDVQILSYRFVERGVQGLFIDLDRNWFFEYHLDFASSGVTYRPHQFIADLSEPKIKLLPQLNNDEINVILDILLFINQFSGTLTLLVDEDFEDEDAALEKYGFYPAYEGSCPVLFYQSEGEILAMGTHLFWGDEEMDGLEDFFVNDNYEGAMYNFETLTDAIKFLAQRLNYYIAEA